jgi:hypothetical protein
MNKLANFIVEKGKSLLGKGEDNKKKGQEHGQQENQNSKTVKAKVRQELASQLPPTVTNTAELKNILHRLYNKYHKEGLKSLEVNQVAGKLGQLEILVTASPTERGGITKVPLRFDLKDIGDLRNSVTLYASVNGKLLEGKFKNLPGEPGDPSTAKHAEELLIAILKDDWDELTQGHKGQNIITIQITSSPCGEEGDDKKFHNCAKNLVNFAREKGSNLTIQMVGVYKGRHRKSSKEALEELNNAGVHLQTWEPNAAIEQLKQKFGEMFTLEMERRIRSKLTNVLKLLKDMDLIKEGTS